MKVDIVNGCFELGAGLLQILNIKMLIKDKQVKGISMIPLTLFTLWGFWNLIYYSALNQPYSYAGGLVIVTTNMIWLGLAYYYKKNKIKESLKNKIEQRW